MKKFEIPEGTARIVIRGRHSKSVQDGPNETRTLTPEGMKLAQEASPAWRAFIASLEEKFSPAAYACSPFPRSLLTTFLVTGASQITTDPRLTLTISVKKAPAPEGSEYPSLYAHLKKGEGKSVPEILAILAADTSLFGTQPVDTAIEQNEEFLRAFAPDSSLIVTFDHEPVIGLLAAKHGASPEDIGLNECQGSIFFMNAEGQILDVAKFAPSCTLL